jgi:hypothetical protein
MTRFLEPTRERFLLAIAASLPAERFIELHFFPPIRQGGVESGVAVIAAHPEVAAEPVLADAPPPPEDLFDDVDATADEDEATPRRYTVYTAKYKLVLKGPDRGKWECGVVAEADAPLVTVETVVRGVQRRSGDTDEPERMSGDEAREFVIAAAR